MPPLKPILRFFFTAVALYVLLILPWPGLREAYREGYRIAANLCLSTFGSQGEIEFRVPTTDEIAKRPGTADAGDLAAAIARRTVTYQELTQKDGTVVKVPLTGKPVGVVSIIPTGRVGYVPTAELIALILATPILWSRRLRALIAGLVLVNLFIGARLAMMLLFCYSQDSAMRQFDWGPTATNWIAGLYEFFYVSPTGSFLIPPLIWALVTIRSDDVRAMLPGEDERFTADE